MDARSEGIDQLIALIYEKILGQSPWSEVGDAIADACGLTSPLIVHRPERGEPTRFLTREMAHTETAYDTQFASIDFVLHHVLANESRKNDFQASQILTPAELNKNAFWMEFVRPLSARDIYFSVLKPTDGHKFYLSFHAANDSKFDPARENALRKTLIMHMSNALALSLRTQRGGSAFTSLSYLFDDLDCAAAVLKPDGIVLEINDAMRQLLGDGLLLERGRLRSEFPAEQHLLDELVSTPILIPHPQLREHIVLASSSGRPLHLRTMRAPLRSLFRPENGFCDGVTLLLVTTAHFSKLRSERNLISLGLTASEAAVANLVGSGMSTEETSLSTGLKLSTVRQYLKQAYQKLGVNRQSELTRMVLRLDVGEHGGH